MASLPNSDYRFLQQIPNECVCSRCGEVYTKPKKLGCNHIACNDCINEMYEYEGGCGICEVPIDLKAVRSGT